MIRFALSIAVLLVLVGAVEVPDNPCPNIFQYRLQGRSYYGEIAIPYDGTKDLNLAVNISMAGLYQNAKLHMELLTPPENILSSPYLMYRVNFPNPNSPPRITQISFNNRIYCYGPAEPLGARGITNLWSNLVYRINQYTYTVESGIKQPQSYPQLGSTASKQPPSYPQLGGSVSEQPQSYPQLSGTTSKQPQNYQFNTPRTGTIPPTPPPPQQEVCGVANDIQTLVLKGQKTIDNEFPWLVAMFHHQGVTYEFQCTGNLITNRFVVTAAHCVWFYKAPLINKEDILLVLGRSDISHWASTGALIRTALDVIPHPSYKQGSGHCDVALIKMNEEVTFKPSVRPVCLWAGDVNLKKIREGVVAGWGKSENGKGAVNEPRKITMPVVSQEACLRSNIGFQNLTSDKTFCAGNRDGSGPCSGDSGAGFVVKQNGKWYLRGLVSTALKNEDFSCNLNEYIVFSDIAKLRDWIVTTVT